MGKYFERILENKKAEARAQAERSIESILGKAAYEGTALSGPHHRRQIDGLINVLDIFGNELLANLTRVEADHSPIGLNDFEVAKQELELFVVYLSELLESRKNRWKAPASVTLGSEGKLERTVNKLQSSIDLAQAEFESRRSFWKWAIGDLRKQIWSGGLVILGGFLVWLFEVLRGVI